MKIIIGGDLCPKHRVVPVLERGEYDTLLGEVRPVVVQADYSLVNLECPVVEHRGAPIAKCGPNLKTTSKVVELVKYAGFSAVTLANNHFLDYGEEGVRDTLAALNHAGVDHVGGGMNIEEASSVLYKVIAGEKVAFVNCCEHEFSIATKDSAGANPLNPIRQYRAIKEAKNYAQYVVVIVHGGHEHYQLPSPRMQETYRFFVEAGADAVVNHHQHCFSGYEYYKGKPIVYGLGNFLFDEKGKVNLPWDEGYMVMLCLEKGYVAMETIPYIQCADNVGVHLLTDRNCFEDKLLAINTILEDENKLHSCYEEWMQGGMKAFDVLFSPYNGRYLKAACRRGLLPAFMGKSKQAQIYNYVNCESHREKLLAYLASKLK